MKKSLLLLLVLFLVGCAAGAPGEISSELLSSSGAPQTLPMRQDGKQIVLENNCVLTLGMRKEDALANLSNAGIEFRGYWTLELREKDLQGYWYGPKTTILYFCKAEEGDVEILTQIEIDSPEIETQKGLVADDGSKGYSKPEGITERIYGPADETRIYVPENTKIYIYYQDDIVFSTIEEFWNGSGSVREWIIELRDHYIPYIESVYTKDCAD